MNDELFNDITLEADAPAVVDDEVTLVLLLVLLRKTAFEVVRIPAWKL